MNNRAVHSSDQGCRKERLHCSDEGAEKELNIDIVVDRPTQNQNVVLNTRKTVGRNGSFQGELVQAAFAAVLSNRAGADWCGGISGGWFPGSVPFGRPPVPNRTTNDHIPIRPSEGSGIVGRDSLSWRRTLPDSAESFHETPSRTLDEGPHGRERKGHEVCFCNLCVKSVA